MEFRMKNIQLIISVQNKYPREFLKKKIIYLATKIAPFLDHQETINLKEQQFVFATQHNLIFGTYLSYSFSLKSLKLNTVGVRSLSFKVKLLLVSLNSLKLNTVGVPCFPTFFFLFLLHTVREYPPTLVLSTTHPKHTPWFLWSPRAPFT